VVQGLVAAVALGTMALSRLPFAEFGFRRPTQAKGHFKLWWLLLGAARTGVLLAFGLRGMRAGLAAYGLPGLVLWIWVISSIVEELFAGLVPNARRRWRERLARRAHARCGPVKCRAVWRHASAVAVR